MKKGILIADNMTVKAWLVKSFVPGIRSGSYLKK